MPLTRIPHFPNLLHTKCLIYGKSGIWILSIFHRLLLHIFLLCSRCHYIIRWNFGNQMGKNINNKNPLTAIKCLCIYENQFVVTAQQMKTLWIYISIDKQRGKRDVEKHWLRSTNSVAKCIRNKFYSIQRNSIIDHRQCWYAWIVAFTVAVNGSWFLQQFSGSSIKTGTRICRIIMLALRTILLRVCERTLGIG